MWKNLQWNKKCDVMKKNLSGFYQPWGNFFIAITYLRCSEPTEIIKILMGDTMFWQSHTSPARWGLSSSFQVSTLRSFPNPVSHSLFSALPFIPSVQHDLAWISQSENQTQEPRGHIRRNSLVPSPVGAQGGSSPIVSTLEGPQGRSPLLAPNPASMGA